MALHLGRILVQEGVLDAAKLAAALQQQQVYGGRLGTNLIELGYATADEVARALAKMFHVPAALTKHFERHDPDLLQRIPAEVAGRLMAFPIAYAMAGGRRAVICLDDPHNAAAIAELEALVGVPVIPSVAPETSIYAWLERAYGLAVPPRFSASSEGTMEALPHSRSDRHAIKRLQDEQSIDIDIEDDEAMPSLQLVDLDDSSVERDLSQYGHDTRNSRSSLIDMASTRPVEVWDDSPRSVSAAAARRSGLAAAEVPEVREDPRTAAQAIAAARTATARAHAAPRMAPAAGPAPLDFSEALSGIAAAEHRDHVAEAVLGYMRGGFGAGLMLLVKNDLALGHRGFGGNFDGATVESIVVPLSVPSVFRTAFDEGGPFRGAPGDDSHLVQNRFFKLFALRRPPAEVAVVPVLLRTRVVCLLYGHGPDAGRIDDVAFQRLTDLATATSQAFIRLIRLSKS